MGSKNARHLRPNSQQYSFFFLKPIYIEVKPPTITVFLFSLTVYLSKQRCPAALSFSPFYQNGSRTIHDKMSGFLRTDVLPVIIHHLPIFIFFTSKPIYIASKPPIIAIFSVSHSRNFLKNIRFKRYGYILMLGL